MYLGLSKDAWDFIFGAFNALVVVVGAPFAVQTLRHSLRQRQNESLTKLLEEYRSVEFRNSVRHTISRFPVFEGTVADRVSAFVEYGRLHLNKHDLEEARAVVHKLNDVGAFIDRNGVLESDFYGHTFPRLIELSARLEPLVLAVSAARGFRWGMRIRRMGIGARAYYRASKLHRLRPFRIDDLIVVPEGRDSWRRTLVHWTRRLLGVHVYTPSAVGQADQDARDLAESAAVLAGFGSEDLEFLSYAV